MCINYMRKIAYKIYLYICDVNPTGQTMKLQDKKRVNAILFFAGKSQNYTINRLKLVKLLWLADRIHLNKYGRMILGDQYYALPHGPVPSATKNVSEETIDDVFYVEGFMITAEDTFDSKYFSESDLEVMKQVWKKYGLMDQFNLRDLSHKFPEWKRFEEQLEDEEISNSYRMKIADFFEDAVEDTDYEYDEEQSNKAKDNYKYRQNIEDSLYA